MEAESEEDDDDEDDDGKKVSGDITLSWGSLLSPFVNVYECLFSSRSCFCRCWSCYLLVVVVSAASCCRTWFVFAVVSAVCCCLVPLFVVVVVYHLVCLQWLSALVFKVVIEFVSSLSPQTYNCGGTWSLCVLVSKSERKCVVGIGFLCTLVVGNYCLLFVHWWCCWISFLQTLAKHALLEIIHPWDH